MEPTGIATNVEVIQAFPPKCCPTTYGHTLECRLEKAERDAAFWEKAYYEELAINEQYERERKARR